MKKYFTITLMLVLLCGIFAYANSKKNVKQTKCPICQMDVKKDIYTDYQGMRVFFCNKKCIEKFKKDPKKYISKMKKEGIVLKKVNKKKPSCAGLPCEATCNKK